MKLSSKLIVSFSVVVILVGGIGLISSYLNEKVKDQVTEESEKAIQEVKLADELGINLFQSLTRTQYLMDDRYRQDLSLQYSRSNRTEEVQISRINTSLEEFKQDLDNLRGMVTSQPENFFEHSVDTSAVLSLINDLDEKFKNYTSLLEQFQSIETTGSEDRRIFFNVTIEPYFRTNLLPAIEELRNKIQASHHQKVANMNSQLDRIGYILIIATAVALAVAILLALYIYRSITTPLTKIVKAAEKIGAGNLKERIDYNAKDEMGQLSRAFDQMAENLSKTTVSRDYVDSIISAMANFLFVTDDEFNIKRINSSALIALDCSEQSLVNTPVEQLFEDISQQLFEKNNASKKKSFTGKLKRSDQTSLPVSISKGVIKNSEGDIEGYVFVASDISSQKKAQRKIAESLREKEVLLAEIHHRVKNNLAVISGLLQMQMWESEDNNARSALQKSHLRVQSIALVHEKLYQSDSLSYIQFDRYLKDLLDAIVEVYDSPNINITTNFDAVSLNVNQAIPCALLINELVINAYKYAFEEEAGGEITVRIRLENQQVVIEVSDNGRGFQEVHDQVYSLGLDLVETLAAQLNGKLDIYNDNGAHISVRFVPDDISVS
ncbi:MAG: sensor histidine kinase [Bacteroidota bacterium]